MCAFLHDTPGEVSQPGGLGGRCAPAPPSGRWDWAWGGGIPSAAAERREERGSPLAAAAVTARGAAAPERATARAGACKGPRAGHPEKRAKLFANRCTKRFVKSLAEGWMAPAGALPGSSR